MFELGAHTRETDFSLYVAGISKIAFGVVGTATKGKIGEPTFVSNQAEFARHFGDQSPDCLATYAAMEYLTQGNQLWFTRVGAADSLVKSTATVKSGTATDAMTVTGKTAGTAHDGIRVAIENAETTAPFKFDLKVIDQSGKVVELFRAVNTDPASPDFVEKVVNVKSALIDVDMVGASAVQLAESIVALVGGDNGIAGINSADYIGSPTVKVGLESMKAKNVDFTLLAVPGNSDPEVVVAGYGIAQERGDSLFLVDPPQGLTSTEVTEWHNGAGTFTDHQAFNSSYGALYWSWQEIYDSPNGVKVWCPPSGLVAAAMAFSANQSELWFAPAGLRRGLLKSVLRSEHNPDQGEMQLLYNNGNNVNPIIKHPQAGIAIFGQKTLQRQPSATDRVNVRLLLNYLRKVVAGTAAYLAFDPNDRVTWNEFEDLVEPLLRNVKVKRGVYNYRIQMDSVSVTNADIDEYRMPGRIFIQPTKAAEEIAIDFVITRTGAEFITYEQV